VAADKPGRTRPKEAGHDLTTEEKIRQAARTLFTRKGYAATRTRDIAEEAHINLALLNYYFRSKEKLFAEIMLEKVQQLFGVLVPVLNDASTGLEDKIARIVTLYTRMISENPDLPIFVLNEIKGRPAGIKKVLPLDDIIPHSSFIIQLRERRPDINPFHFLLNILGMTVFPFIVMPALDATGILGSADMEALIAERIALVPAWTEAMLKAP
jgi:AcrR family transcriptional regulator